MYGSGLRVMESVRLRVQDVDFSAHQLAIDPRSSLMRRHDTGERQIQ